MCANYYKPYVVLSLRDWSMVSPMDRADLYRVYELGAALHPLTNVSDETTLEDIFRSYIGAQRALNVFLGNDPQIKVELCLQAARELLQEIKGIENHFFRDKEGKFKYPDDPTQKLNFWAYDLRPAIQNFEAVFRAEMQAASTYFVPKRGAYSTRDLVDNFDCAFLPELTKTIGQTALGEYRNAGRCFAFGLWTAAGYHSCRAVEAVLREYYSDMTGRESRDGQTWGALIDDLEKEKEEPIPSAKTLFYLRQLKDSERNPLMHVRIVLDEQDADLLLGSAKVVMVLMAREMMDFGKRVEELSKPQLKAIEGDKA